VTAPGPGGLAARVVATLTGRGQTVAVAESLTGGLLAASLVDVPGASVVFRGGVVAYATDLKAALLGVPAALLERHGAVHADVAAAMAEGVRDRLGATFGVATTGVAGPDPSDGQPVGTVHIAAAGPAGTRRRPLSLAGDRRSIRDQTVAHALRLLCGILEAAEA
jgi:nicotinamide-nucleotide amidase